MKKFPSELTPESASKLQKKLTWTHEQEFKSWQLEIEEEKLMLESKRIEIEYNGYTLDCIVELKEVLSTWMFPYDLPISGADQHPISVFNSEEHQRIKIKLFELINKL